MFMRTAILWCAVTASTALADDAKPFCEAVSTVAEGVMEARQFGAPLTDAMERVARNPLSREIVLAAYEVDVRATSNGKAREIGRFRDAWTLRCYRGDLAAMQ